MGVHLRHIAAGGRRCAVDPIDAAAIGWHRLCLYGIPAETAGFAESIRWLIKQAAECKAGGADLNAWLWICRMPQ